MAIDKMDGPGLKVVDNETHVRVSRTSVDGKTITYEMSVIQQPERARACGAGAKSSADRRPVDPPPILELKIFESDGDGELKDVTFSMNSNYLAFATLEQARHVAQPRNLAQGRVQQDSNGPTVLTGTPVAGMVYLERPNPAGYFIFSDLSVRHEGKYRLSFNLYEEIKDSKKEDRIDDDAKPAGWHNGYVTHRLEVRSTPFSVFSAKKFPGLSESTALSRVVAEQGCRVRIRRDVRMRRRDNKSSKEWDGYEDETSEMRARLSATPEASGFAGHGFMEPIPRPRSGSNASHPSLAPSTSRRPSLQDINQAYHQPAYAQAPQTPQNAYAQSSPYVTGPSPSQPSYGQHPLVQQQSSMQPPPSNYHQHSHQQTLPPAPAAPSHPSYYGYASAPAPAMESSSHPQRHSMDYSPHVSSESRRSSNLYTPSAQALPPLSYTWTSQQNQMYPSQAAPQSTYQQGHDYQSSYSWHQDHKSSSGSLDIYNRHGPAEPVQPPTRTSGAHTPLSARPFNDKLPAIDTTFGVTSVKAIEPASPISAAIPPSQYGAQRPLDTHGKRNFGDVFSERHLAQPLRQGARPKDSFGRYAHDSAHDFYVAPDADAFDDGGDHEFDKMVYRRADGRQVNRTLPPQD